MYRDFINKVKGYSADNLQVFEEFVGALKWEKRTSRENSIGIEAIVFSDTCT